MKKVTIYPDDVLFKKLEKESHNQSRSMNNFIILVLKDYFRKGKK